MKTAVFGTAESCVYGTHRRQVFGTAEEGVAVLAIDFARGRSATHPFIAIGAIHWLRAVSASISV